MLRRTIPSGKRLKYYPEEECTFAEVGTIRKRFNPFAERLLERSMNQMGLCIARYKPELLLLVTRSSRDQQRRVQRQSEKS